MNLSLKVKINLLEKANRLPETPGCYLMKNNNEEIIYVGKAKNLKTRVSSYFQDRDLNIKTQFLVSHIVDFDFLIAENDAESFIIENNLIKKHHPKYNIRLKDNKTYPYVVINWNENYPRLEYKRKITRADNIENIGPFVVGSNVSEVLRVLNRQLQLRDCSLSEFKRRKEPCLLYQIKECSAPCVQLISKVEYSASLKIARDVLVKSGNKFRKKLLEEMQKNSDEMEFEKAASVRDDLNIIENFIGNYKQVNAEWSEEQDVDIVGVFVGEIEIDISLYMVRKGQLLGQKNLHLIKNELSDDDVTLTAIVQFYQSNENIIPKFLITPFSIEENHLLSVALKIKVLPGNKPHYLKILQLTKEHAFESQRMRLFNLESPLMGLLKLQDLLGLKERPIKLECYDIAIFQGEAPAASQIVSIDGVLIKEEYRHYHMQELPEGNNDFAMMEEVITRRLKYGALPDVFIVDGGIQQVNVFLRVLKKQNISLPVAGIAKQKGSEKVERLIIPGRLNPYPLLKNRSLAKIIISMRDEAHRFSRRLHHHQMSKNLIKKR